MIDQTTEMIERARAAYRTSQAPDAVGQMRDVVAAVLALMEEQTAGEVERLRAELETMRFVAQGNKRHVAENTAILERVEALTKDANGGDLNGAEIVVVGKIRRALREPVPTRPAEPNHSPGAADVLPDITCTIPGHCDGDNGPQPTESELPPEPPQVAVDLMAALKASFPRRPRQCEPDTGSTATPGGES